MSIVSWLGTTHLVPFYLKNAYCGRGAWWCSLSLEASLYPRWVQTHVHWVCDAIQPSHPLSSPPALNLSQHQGLCKWQLFSSGGQSIGVLASASVLPMDNQDWFPLGWTGRISLQSKGLSRVFSLRTTCLVAMGIRCLWLNWPPRLTNMKFHAKISHFQKDCNNPLCSQSPL